MPTNPHPDPYRPLDDGGRDLLRQLMEGVRHAILACHDPEGGGPLLSRIAVQADPGGTPVALLSGLAVHSRALARDARAGLLIAPPVGKGDPMTQARLSLQVTAERLPEITGRRTRWLERDPKARVYIDLPDFAFWRLSPVAGLLNAGFGRAFRIRPADMEKPPA